jgi:hypothetical protein
MATKDRWITVRANGRETKVMAMNQVERKTLADFFRGQAHACYSEAIKELEEAREHLREIHGDGESIELAISAALVNVGEARGFLNAASDVAEGEDKAVTEALGARPKRGKRR